MFFFFFSEKNYHFFEVQICEFLWGASAASRLQETSAEVNDVLVVRRPPGYSLQGHPQSEFGGGAEWCRPGPDCNQENWPWMCFSGDSSRIPW